MHELRYPIGEFQAPAEVTADHVRAAALMLAAPEARRPFSVRT